MVLISFCDSESIQTLVSWADLAAQRASHRAKVSARKGEDTKEHIVEPSSWKDRLSAEMIHPKPAFRDEFDHSASEKHLVVSRSGGATGLCCCFMMGTWHSSFCANFHSLAPPTALVTTVLFSKTKQFLAIQMIQHIYEKISDVIPVRKNPWEEIKYFYIGKISVGKNDW